MNIERIFLLFLWIVICLQISAGNVATKEILVPRKEVESKGFDKPDGNFSHKYKAETENLVLFWDKSFGSDPTQYADSDKRFFPEKILKEAERFYCYYVDKLKFVRKGHSYTDKYKMIIWMYNDDESTVYGWGAEGVGMMWMRPCRAKEYPYCALAHEMGHSFQYMVSADGMRGFSGCPLVEYTSQWMLWQVYPDWVTIENYHLKSFMEKTHYAAFHETNMYHAPQLMEYWSNKHGIDIVGKVWCGAVEKEDPVLAYQRLTGINQQQFNDEVYDAATRFVTWDLPRIKKYCSKYANQHHCKMNKVKGDWYEISPTRCPQNYGYNAIRLNIPDGGRKISLNFDGLVGDKRFQSARVGQANWRYGFLAVKQNGERIYGAMNIAKNGKNKKVYFEVPEDTQFLWVVVAATPSEHNDYFKQWRQLEEEKGKEEQWPYRIRLSGTSIHEDVLTAKK
ncbi:DUF6055 domain-containing protein [Bacteroides sp. GM023]|uniref:DUF6055 domain-containing protein n=1 Tax=Bacteroides sp. GM023 TaxID=2723058 RepID=UPI001CC2A2CB|nr:DUF6055 domain-containing protein [Bacteroides sp. GM023]